MQQMNHEFEGGLNKTENLEPYNLLLAIKERFSKAPRKKLDDFNEKIRSNIKNIQTICNKNYGNPRGPGNAALNRKILRNPDIAILLTPKTLKAIFQLQDTEMKLEREESAIQPTIADVLEFAFQPGLKSIWQLPNNESGLFGVESEEYRKIAFQENTTKIVENIKNISKKIGLQGAVQQSENIKNNQSSTQLFVSIRKTITAIKEQGESDILLSNATQWEPSVIRSQCEEGLSRLCKLAEIICNFSTVGITIADETVTNLTDFAKKCFINPKCMQDGTVTHLLFDRLHFIACVEHDMMIKIKGTNYPFASLIEEMVKQSESDVASSVKEQFESILSVVKIDLLNKKKELKGNYPHNYFSDLDVECSDKKYDSSSMINESANLNVKEFNNQSDRTYYFEQIKKIQTSILNSPQSNNVKNNSKSHKIYQDDTIIKEISFNETDKKILDKIEYAFNVVRATKDFRHSDIWKKTYEEIIEKERLTKNIRDTKIFSPKEEDAKSKIDDIKNDIQIMLSKDIGTKSKWLLGVEIEIGNNKKITVNDDCAALWNTCNNAEMIGYQAALEQLKIILRRTQIEANSPWEFECNKIGAKLKLWEQSPGTNYEKSGKSWFSFNFSSSSSSSSSAKHDGLEDDDGLEPEKDNKEIFEFRRK